MADSKSGAGKVPPCCSWAPGAAVMDSLSKLLAGGKAGGSTGKDVSVVRKAGVRNTLEMEDVLFHHDSAVMMPMAPTPEEKDKGSAAPEQDAVSGLDVIAACLEYVKAHKGERLIVVGHTDTTGDKLYNVKLSWKRAGNALAALEGDRDTWVSIADEKHKVQDYKQILKWVSLLKGWPCDPGKVDDVDDDATKAAVKKFQETYNDQYEKTIKVDGIVGKETFGAFFDIYEETLRALMRVEAAEVKKMRDGLTFLDKSKKSVGCGEYKPIDNPELDNYRSARNRRVEFLFFEPETPENKGKPKLDCHPSKDSCSPTVCQLYDPSLFKPSYIPVIPRPFHPWGERIKIVELVEVYTEAGAEKTRAPSARKQYINLDDSVDTAAAHPEYGRVIQLKARAEWVSGDKWKTLAGKKVYWYSKPGAGNKTGLTGSEPEGFDSPGGDKKVSTPTDEAGWTPVVKFNLSLYGGDEFTIGATDDEAYTGGMTAGAFTIWRRFWYQVTEMKDAASGKFALAAAVTTAFEDGYKTVFMEYSEKTPRNEGTHVGNLPSDSDRANEAKKYFSADSLSPFKCHIMTIDYAQTDNEVKSIEDTPAGLTWTSPSWLFLWKFGGGAFPWKVSAKYQPKAGSWTDIPDSALSTTTHSTQPGFKKIKVDLSGVSPAPATPVKIKIEAKVAGPGIALGWGGGSHHLYLCTGALIDSTVAADRDPTQKSDSVHEIGHALGLVNKPPAAAGAHDAWEDTTHSHHCKKPATTCAMWWQSSTTRLTTFHVEGGAGCHDYLRRQDYSRDVMKDRWKD